MPAPGDIFDGYELLRPIGQGGFGEVWLCRAPATGDWRALKFIARENAKALDKEFEALARYRRVAAKLRSPGLMPVEHANRRTDGLYYVMPLADGMDSSTPDSSEWRPLTLRGRLDARRGESSWFTGREVVSWMEPVLAGLQCLAEAGLVHRDIKPDNILFFDGKPCLGDISLLTEDGTQITRHGTPGYSTPSWFIGGHHDMYGAAALLYTLLTGNDPDRMGRSAFQWPPQGESSLSPEEHQEWLRLHAVVRRATEERPTERYADFSAMAEAIRGARESAASSNHKPVARLWLKGAVALFAVNIAAWILYEKNAETKSYGNEKAKSDTTYSKAYEKIIADLKTVKDAHCRKLDAFMEPFQKNLSVIQTKINESATHPVDSDEFENDLRSIIDSIKPLAESIERGNNSPSKIAESAQEAEDKIIAIAGGVSQNADEKFYYEKKIFPKISDYKNRYHIYAALWPEKHPGFKENLNKLYKSAYQIYDKCNNFRGKADSNRKDRLLPMSVEIKDYATIIMSMPMYY